MDPLALAETVWDTVRVDGPQWTDRVALSLSDGYPGIALLFAELAAHDDTWRPRLHTVLSLAGARLTSAPWGAGLYTGPASLALALRMAQNATGGYARARTGIITALTRLLDDRLSTGVIRRRLAARQLTMADYDVVSGLSGSLRHLLLDPADHRDLIARLLAELVTVVHSGEPGRPGWTVAHPPLIGTDPAEFPLGHINAGMAHGAAGILAVLAIALREGILVAGQAEAAAALAEWLVAQRLRDANGITWPSYVAVHSGAAAPTSRPTGWCYGIPGTATALRLAGEALGRADLSAAADQAMRSMISRPFNHTGGAEALDRTESGHEGYVGGAEALDRTVTGRVGQAGRAGVNVVGTELPGEGESGLCHGWSGTIQAVWRWSTRSPAEVPDGWAEQARRQIRAPAGDIGFLTGTAGIALALLRASRGGPPAVPWDSALVLD